MANSSVATFEPTRLKQVSKTATAVANALAAYCERKPYGLDVHSVNGWKIVEQVALSPSHTTILQSAMLTRTTSEHYARMFAHCRNCGSYVFLTSAVKANAFIGTCCYLVNNTPLQKLSYQIGGARALWMSNRAFLTAFPTLSDMSPAKRSSRFLIAEMEAKDGEKRRWYLLAQNSPLSQALTACVRTELKLMAARIQLIGDKNNG